MPTVRTDGIEIHYEERGHGQPLVLIGGITSTLEVWDLLVPALASRHRVITPDNRGSGRTRETSGGDRSIATFAADVKQLLDGLGIERAHLLGASMGGMIVQEFAVTWPERLATLIVACSAPWGLGDPMAVPPDPECAAALIDSRPLSAEEEEARTLRAMVHPDTPKKRPERAEFYLSTKRRWPHSKEEVARRAAAVAGWTVYDRLPRLAGVPTLVLAGADDRLVRPANSQRIAERIPGAEFAAVPDTAHVFFVEDPESTSQLVLDFTRRHSSA